MLIKVRVKATGQIVEMIPSVARAMLQGGTVEEVIETAMVDPQAEKAVTRAKNPEPRKIKRA